MAAYGRPNPRWLCQVYPDVLAGDEGSTVTTVQLLHAAHVTMEGTASAVVTSCLTFVKGFGCSCSSAYFVEVIKVGRTCVSSSGLFCECRESRPQ